MKITTELTAEILRCNDGFYVLTHAHPDGDTLGSGIALCIALQKIGKKAKLICPDGFPERFNFLLNGYVEQEFEREYVVAVDVADNKLLGDLKDEYQHIDLCIDHHVSNVLFADNLLLNSNAAAAAEVIYELINYMGIPMDKNMACAIYTGIATDTGCFKYSNTTSRTHLIVSELMSYDFNKDEINYRMFDLKTKKRIKLETAIFDGMEFYYKDKCAVAIILQSYLDELGADYDEFDGLSSLPRQIDGVEIGITIRQKKENYYKISMRSGNVNVAEICESLGGGGHIRAAGCAIEADLDTTKVLLLKQVKKYLM